MRKYWWIGCLAVTLLACREGDLDVAAPATFQPVVPPGFPDISYPEDNIFTPARWALGKKLFYDTRLSRDASVSCASCHRPELAFSDHLAISPGAGGLVGTRNAPSLANVAYHPYFTREGGVPTLEMQVLVPIQEAHEFDFNIIEAAERLAQDVDYQHMSQEAYNRPFDYYVITRAIANFERALISGRSRYDKLVSGDATNVFTPEESLGMELFFSARTQCANCHGGFNFTNYAFTNNGLYARYADPGRMRLTGKSSDRALFKNPSLRNVAVTAPYMHDGSMATLEDVVEHYNLGGHPHPHRHPAIRPLHLTDHEKKALVAFLHTLTDETFLHLPHFQPD